MDKIIALPPISFFLVVFAAVFSAGAIAWGFTWLVQRIKEAGRG